MPSAYFGDHWENLDQIKFLLAARRFYFIFSSTVLDSSYLLSARQTLEKLSLETMSLVSFSRYLSGNYFPPLQVKISGFKTLSGTGFGIFSTEDIPQNCFIGEYATDILTERFSLQVKRADSIMTLAKGKRPESTVILGPVKRCSYVCLVNGSSESEANCSVVKV